MFNQQPKATAMFKTLAIFLLPLLAGVFTSPLLARDKAQGFCEQGNQQVLTASVPSTTRVQRSYPSCTLTVYLAGTMTLASLYSDNSGTVAANPFTADNRGQWYFYADNGRYDVQFSSAGISPTFTHGDYTLFDPATSNFVSGSSSLVTPGVVPYIVSNGVLGQDPLSICINPVSHVTALGGCPTTSSFQLDVVGATRTIGITSLGGVVDFSAAAGTSPVRTGTTMPGTCSVGQIFYKTNATPGLNLYACTATNVWSVEGGAPANYVTTDTAQSITGQKTFTLDPIVNGTSVLGTAPGITMKRDLISTNQFLQFLVGSSLQEGSWRVGPVPGSGGLAGQSVFTLIHNIGTVFSLDEFGNLEIPGNITISRVSSAGTITSLAGVVQGNRFNVAGSSPAGYQVAGTTVIDQNRNATVVNLLVTGTCTGCGGGGGGGGLPVTDATPLVFSAADNTKLIRLSASNLSPNTTRVLSSPDFDGTLLTDAGPQTITGIKTFSNDVYIASTKRLLFDRPGRLVQQTIEFDVAGSLPLGGWVMGVGPGGGGQSQYFWQQNGNTVVQFSEAGDATFGGGVSATTYNGTGNVTISGGTFNGPNFNMGSLTGAYSVRGTVAIDGNRNGFFNNMTITGSCTGCGGGGGGGLPVSDITNIVYNNADNTKIVKFDASQITTGATRTYTFPNASVTLTGLENAQTFSGQKNFGGNLVVDPTSIFIKNRSSATANGKLQFWVGGVSFGQGVWFVGPTQGPAGPPTSAYYFTHNNTDVGTLDESGNLLITGGYTGASATLAGIVTGTTFNATSGTINLKTIQNVASVALQIKGSSAGNGNVSLQGGPVVANSSVVAEGGMSSQPAMIVKEQSSQTGPSFKVTDVGGTQVFAIMGTSDTAARVMISGTHVALAGNTYDVGALTNRWQTYFGQNINLNGAVTLTGTAASSASAGGVSALPALPAGYYQLTINGVAVKIPFYLN